MAFRKIPFWLRVAMLGAAGLGALVLVDALREAARRPPADAPRVELTVDGLDCPVWCAIRLQEQIDGLDGVRVERLDQKAGKVVVQHDPARQNLDALRRWFARAGFPVQATAAVASGR